VTSLAKRLSLQDDPHMLGLGSPEGEFSLDQSWSKISKSQIPYL